MLCRTEHNPDVPVPYHQICRLRAGNSLKPLDPVVKIVRWRIGVRKTSPLVDGMHQVGAIVFAISMLPRGQSRSNNRSPVVPAQAAVPPMSGGSPACDPGRMGILVDPGRVLCRKATRCHPEHQSCDRGFPEIPHGPILMPILSAVLVTLVQEPVRNRARPTLTFLLARSIDKNPGNCRGYPGNAGFCFLRPTSATAPLPGHLSFQPKNLAVSSKMSATLVQSFWR